MKESAGERKVEVKGELRVVVDGVETLLYEADFFATAAVEPVTADGRGEMLVVKLDGRTFACYEFPAVMASE